MNKLNYSAEYGKLNFSFEFESDKELIEKSNLGKTRQTCKLCGESGDFQTWRGIENFVGLGDEFRYFECPHCEILQIEEFPKNIGKYYAHDYYSYTKPNIEPVKPGSPRDGRRILDAGCGAGNWLCFLATIGCVNLFGCDPFIEQDLEYKNGVKIYKKSIHEMEGQYDVIHLSHSFEHMSDPKETFETFKRLLKGKGRGILEEPKIEILIPVFPNAAFDVFGPYWYQMDSPRHFFLHSKKSIQTLAEKNGFYIEKAEFVSLGTQFSVSRLYQQGVTFLQAGNAMQSGKFFNAGDIELFGAAAKIANIAGRGDCISFTIRRK